MVEIEAGEMNEEFLQYYTCQECGEGRILEDFLHCPQCGQVIERFPWYKRQGEVDILMDSGVWEVDSSAENNQLLEEYVEGKIAVVKTDDYEYIIVKKKGVKI